MDDLARTKDNPEYIFYDGPPFATGLPHYGHILAGTIKDIVTRYQSMTGHHVTRRFGWDCHGLPVENEIDKKLGIKRRDDVLKLGIDKYNEECRSIVTRYVEEWEKVITRTGRWIDFKNDYKTMDLKFMETVWWVFGQLYEKGLVYKGFKVMPYSTSCKTPLSNFEAGQDYKVVNDPEVLVTFPIVGEPQNAALVAWTTTPWTLPSNLALCVNATFTYVKTKGSSVGKKDNVEDSYEVLERVSGASPVGLKYEPLFNYFSEFSDVAFRVVADNYVTDDSGTGIVHCAPAFGEDDYRVCSENQIIRKLSTQIHFNAIASSFCKSYIGYRIELLASFGISSVKEFKDYPFGENLIVAVDDDGCFTERITDFSGCYIKDADKDIIESVKVRGRLVKSGTLYLNMSSKLFLTFEVWKDNRPDNSLVFVVMALFWVIGKLLFEVVEVYFVKHLIPAVTVKLLDLWFIRVEQLKDQLLVNNKQTYWVPDFVKEKRFHNWLENARDWAVSRSRFWGTRLPVWISEDGEEIVVIDSIEKLEKLSGAKVFDLHCHNIDHITIPSNRGPEFGVLHRIDDVFDCWFESGSMPYAYIHYPFENVELFEKNFPGHFVAEGLIRLVDCLFYTLMVLSTALFGKPAFRNLICNGLVLAEDGRKMSKSLKNYPPPMEVIDDYGADALRLYLINSPVVRAETLHFKKEGVYGVVKDVFLPWYNAYRFLVQNAKRLEVEDSAPFVPIDLTTLQKSSNVLDQWINSATQSLVYFVRQEMNYYRLYTVLILSCKVMAPFTPFFTEVLYQNMRKVSNELEESIHYCSFPLAEGKRDERIEQSVTRMMTIIDLARNIHECHNKPLKTPLREMVIVHPDLDFLDDIAGKLREYVLEELNVRSLMPCNDTLKYASLRAEPDFSVLGKRLGRHMGVVAKEVKAMSQENILAFEKCGEVAIAGHCLKLSDIKVVRDFKRPDGTTEQEIDAAGDGDVLVILDLRPDESLFEAGIAREIVNRIQKLRKKAALEPTDAVEVYFESLDQDKSISERVLHSQELYIRDAIGSPLLPSTLMPSYAVIIGKETFHGISSLSFVIRLSRATVAFNSSSILALFSGKTKLADGLQTYLLSRDYVNLKSEFQQGNGKITVDCIENVPAVDLVLGKHLFFTVGDLYSANCNS
ncbi:hypothetical protein FNV43_RR11711 [Rhamnella rubrinervis]|uniref:isoleucine--tRNA ligase n=1 Tax=Rhamnella rubrinervis TaxID=2594499 RepID=A0A8K0H6A5_9ROSA|nr:hypothetical protein FNV43_RR11711 [Rhamnella rubrinervis]